MGIGEADRQNLPDLSRCVGGEEQRDLDRRAPVRRCSQCPGENRLQRCRRASHPRDPQENRSEIVKRPLVRAGRPVIQHEPEKGVPVPQRDDALQRSDPVGVAGRGQHHGCEVTRVNLGDEVGYPAEDRHRAQSPERLYNVAGRWAGDGQDCDGGHAVRE